MAIIRPCAEVRNNYNEISRLCHETSQPIYITKNGFNDLVILSNEAYEKYENERIEKLVSEHFDKRYPDFESFKADVEKHIQEGLKAVEESRVQSMEDYVKEMEEKYGYTLH